MDDLSVITPVHNGAAYLSQAIESVLLQPEVTRHVIVDDASSDSSMEIARAAAQRHPKILVLASPHQQPRGAGATRNVGLEVIDSRFVAFLDADDVYAPKRFARALEILRGNRAVNGVYERVDCHFMTNAAERRYRQAWGSSTTMVTAAVDDGSLFEALALGGQGRFCTPGIVLRLDAVRRTGGFEEGLRFGEDTALWLKLAARYRLVAGVRDRAVADRRVHQHNALTGETAEYFDHAIEGTRRVGRWIVEHSGLPPAERVLALRVLAKRAARLRLRHRLEELGLSRLAGLGLRSIDRVPLRWFRPELTLW